MYCQKILLFHVLVGGFVEMDKAYCMYMPRISLKISEWSDFFSSSFQRVFDDPPLNLSYSESRGLKPPKKTL